MRYILLLSSINFGTEIWKTLLLRGPDGHWGSRHYTVRLFILCGYIFSEYFMNRKILLINQMQPVWLFISSFRSFEHTHKTLQDCKTALISQFWSVMVLSVGSLMLLVMQSHMGFIVTLFMWYVMGQVMQSIEGLKTSWLWLSNTYFMETLTISIYPPPHPHPSPRPKPLPPSPQQTLTKQFQSKCLFRPKLQQPDHVYSEFQIEWMICHAIHMGTTSLQYEGANECWCFQSVRIPFCILCNCVDSLHCDGVCAYSNSQPLCMTLHAGHMGDVSPQCK